MHSSRTPTCAFRIVTAESNVEKYKIDVKCINSWTSDEYKIEKWEIITNHLKGDIKLYDGNDSYMGFVRLNYFAPDNYGYVSAYNDIDREWVKWRNAHDKWCGALVTSKARGYWFEIEVEDMDVTKNQVGTILIRVKDREDYPKEKTALTNPYKSKKQPRLGHSNPHFEKIKQKR